VCSDVVRKREGNIDLCGVRGGVEVDREFSNSQVGRESECL